MLWDKIFHQYDIRGTYPDQLNEKTYFILGQAVATYLAVDKIAVGHDTRLSSPALFQALTAGICDRGTNVVDLGLISTEMNYFASGFYEFPANVIISASHNPAQYNGLKMVTRGAVPLHGDFGLPQIKKLAEENNFPPVDKKGVTQKMDILDDWVAHLLKFVDAAKLKKLKVVIDAGNGMGGAVWDKLKTKLPLEIIPMYFEPDGHFPHHLPDPLKEENVADLKKEIVKQKADLGFATDGDADRIFILDENGRRVSGTIATAMLAVHLLAKYGPAPVLYNAVCGKIVPEVIKEKGGIPIRVRVGHSFIKSEMKKNDALFAGEHSGHFYFKNNFYADSSTIAGLLLLEYLSRQDKPLSQVAAGFGKYPASGEINFEAQDAQEILSAMETKHRDCLSADRLDGLSVWYRDWWMSLRASNTEPMVRLNIEADNQKILDEKLAVVENELTGLGALRK